MKFVDGAPRSSKPAAEVQSKLDAGEVLKRIGTVQQENLQRLDDDIAILMKYLKAESAPKAAIDAMNALSNEVNANWQTTVERIEQLLDE